MASEPIRASQLAAYLKTDGDTKIFLIGGPLSAITSLQEQFHPYRAGAQVTGRRKRQVARAAPATAHTTRTARSVPGNA